MKIISLKNRSIYTDSYVQLFHKTMRNRKHQKIAHNVLFRKFKFTKFSNFFYKKFFFKLKSSYMLTNKKNILFYTQSFNYLNKFQEFLFPLARYRRFATIAPLRGRYYICNYKPKFFFAINSYMLFPNIK